MFSDCAAPEGTGSFLLDVDDDTFPLGGSSLAAPLMAGSSSAGITEAPRVPDPRKHTFIPTDHSSYCAMPKSPSPVKHSVASFDRPSDGVLVVKDTYGASHRTIPSSQPLPTDFSTPKKVYQAGGVMRRKRTACPLTNLSPGLKRRRTCGKDEVDCDPQAHALQLEKREKHKQDERARRTKSAGLIKDLQGFIQRSCGIEYFKCKNRTENPSKQATVETTVARFNELKHKNNKNLNGQCVIPYARAVKKLARLVHRAKEGSQHKTIAEAMLAEADVLKPQINALTKKALGYAK